MSATTYLTVQQVADLAQIEHKTVRRAISGGRLRAFKVGTRVRIREDDALTWIEDRPIIVRRSPPARRHIAQTSGSGYTGPGSVASLKRIEEAMTS